MAEKQEITFTRLESRLGHSLGLFCMCAVFDVPYDTGIEAESWEQYKKQTQELMRDKVFADGTVDVNSAILAGMDREERWYTIWGDGYSETDYKQLDDLYRTMTEQLDDTGGIDRQQEDTARTCAMMALQRNKLIRSRNKDDIAMAKNLDSMIRENLKDSNMRKADILPSAQQRPDGFVDALKKKTGLTLEMTKDDVMQAFFVWLRSHHYPMTIDSVEHTVMAILNTMQKNDDLPELQDLPSDFDFGDYEAEFEKEPNETEIEAYNYLGLVRGEYHKTDDNEDESGDF